MIFDYFTISSIINALTSFTFCFFVLTRNPRSQLNRSFAFFAFSVGFWAVNHFLAFSIQNQAAALFFHRALMAGAIFIPSTFFHFVCVFLDIYDKKKILILYSYIASIIFFASDFTPLFIPSVSKKLFFEYFENFGPMYHPFLVMFAGLTLYSHYLMFRVFRSASGSRKNQIKYVFAGTLIGFIGGSTSFFLVYNIPIPPIGNCLVTVYIIMVAIAIIRDHLMDITIFAVRSAIFLIVYLIVLGIPIGLATVGKEWLVGLGNNWHLGLLLFGMALASAGPFIFMYFQRRAENKLREEERRYQLAITNLTKRIAEIHILNDLLDTETSTVAKEVKVAFCAIYLKEDEYKSFQLKSVYPEEKKSGFPEFLTYSDSLINALNTHMKPLSSEEAGSHEKINLDSGLVVPCFGKEGLLAIIFLGAKPNNTMYTADDTLTFENLSYSTSLAIENCTYWKELEDKHRQDRVYEMDLFSYSLAHEIDNPMSIMRTGIEWIRRYFINEFNPAPEKKAEIERYCGYLMETQQRVSTMVKAIEDFGKKTEGNLEPLKVEAVLAGFTDLYLPHFKHHGIYFTKELPKEKIPFIRGIKQELEEVLVILANNSIYALQEMKVRQERFSQPKVGIKVDLLNNDWLRIIFSDNGEGIRKEDLKLIFNAFVTTKPSSCGTGMGLYNAIRIIEKHRGRIWAESEGKDKGATFIMELPVAKDVSEEDFEKEEQKKRIF